MVTPHLKLCYGRTWSSVMHSSLTSLEATSGHVWNIVVYDTKPQIIQLIGGIWKVSIRVISNCMLQKHKDNEQELVFKLKSRKDCICFLIEEFGRFFPKRKNITWHLCASKVGLPSKEIQCWLSQLLDLSSLWIQASCCTECGTIQLFPFACGRGVYPGSFSFAHLAELLVWNEWNNLRQLKNPNNK